MKSMRKKHGKKESISQSADRTGDKSDGEVVAGRVWMGPECAEEVHVKRKILQVRRNEAWSLKPLLNTLGDVDHEDDDSFDEVIGGKRSPLSLLFFLSKRRTDEILRLGEVFDSGFLPE